MASDDPTLSGSEDSQGGTPASSGSPGWKAPPRSWGGTLLAIGPAIVVSGSVIGSGELINVPVQAAKFGFVLFWAVILSCVIKYFLQVELGRYCLVHNRTTIQALNQCPGPKFRGTGWIGIIYLVGYTLSVVTVGGILASTAGLLDSVFTLNGVIPGIGSAVASKNTWGFVSFVIVFAILWKGVYGHIEKLIALLVCGFSLSVVVALFLLLLFPDPRYPISLASVSSGWSFSLGDITPGLAAIAVVSLLGALGTTANEMFMYPYWILEKGYADNVGPDTEDGWAERARGWIRVLRVDAGAATLLATVITAAYFLVGSAVFSTDQLTVNPDGSSPEIKDWKRACTALQSASQSETNGPAKQIWSSLTPDGQASIRQGAASTETEVSSDEVGLAALNALIGSRDLYSAEAFATLRDGEDDNQEIADQGATLANQVDANGIDSLTANEVQRLNRMLLDATLGTEAIVPTVPGGMSIVHQLSRIYTDTYGAWSYGIFMFGGFCTLYSTIIVVVAASGRMWTDLLSSMGVINYEDATARRRFNRIFQNLYLAAFLGITWFIPSSPEILVIMGQTINGAFNTPLLMFGIAWLAFHTDKRLRMGRATSILLIITILIIAACLIYGLVLTLTAGGGGH